MKSMLSLGSITIEQEQGEFWAGYWTMPPEYAPNFEPPKILERYPLISDDELFLREKWEYMRYLDKQGKGEIW
jgi:hypothetical protein